MVIDMDKHRRCLVIYDKTWKNIRLFIMNKQGDLKKGDISKWFNIAVDNLIAGGVKEKPDPCTHTQKTKEESKYQEYVKIKGSLLNYALERYERFKLTEEQLRQAIACIFDKATDDRTQDKKYIRLLLGLKLIEEKMEMGHKLYNLNPESEDREEKKKLYTNNELDDVVKKYLP
jgi:hypothetical protein